MPGENDITKVEPKRQLKMIELDHLTEQEQQVIIDVLQRDEILRKNEESRIRKLRLELQDLRRQGTIREGDDSKNLCARCREPLGMFASAEVCPKCKHKVCKTCQVYTPSGKRWVCKVCHKSMQIKIESGEWFYEKLEVDNVRLFGSDLVKASLDRVHTRSKGNMSSPNSFEEQDESSRQHYQGRHNHHSGTPRSTPRGTPRGTPSGTPRGMSPHNSPHRRRANRNQDSVSVTSSESHRSHSQQSQIAHSESGSSRDGMNEKRTNGVPVEVDNTPSKRRSRIKKMFPSFKSSKKSSFEKVSTTSSTDDKDVLTEVPTLTKATSRSGEEDPNVDSSYSDTEVEQLCCESPSSSKKLPTFKTNQGDSRSRLTLDIERANQRRSGFDRKEIIDENSKTAGGSNRKKFSLKGKAKQKFDSLKKKFTFKQENSPEDCHTTSDTEDLNLSAVSSDEEEYLLDLTLDPDIRSASPTYKETMFDAKLKTNQALVTSLIEQYSNPSLSRPSSICFTNSSSDSEDSRAEDVREFEEIEARFNSTTYYNESSSDEDVPDMRNKRNRKSEESKVKYLPVVESGNSDVCPESLLLKMTTQRFQEIAKDSSESDMDLDDDKQPVILHYSLRAEAMDSESELSVILEQTEDSDSDESVHI
ncbi:uncharacterized protein [Antedon mediterranea]|uniref:uncharacterized protein n=1 Tax=Antedon mediterranea TaxID=105859 RepID=UPI003AF8A6B5